MGTRSKHANKLGIILILTAAVVAGGQTTAPAPPSAEAATPATRPALDPEIDRILTQLERRTVADLQARLVWRQDYVIDPDDFLIKRGRLWYRKAQPVAKFLIHFEERITATRRDKLDERHLFDGCWYVEMNSRTKSVTRREIRKPDDPGDPYKVGEGVFPMPFGQKKEDILREFDVAKLPPAEKDPPKTDHLRLTPRAGTNTGQSYKELDFWVEQAGPLAGLPIKVRVAKLEGTGKLNSYITIVFNGAKLNTGLADSLFDIQTPAGYTETKEELEVLAAPAGSSSQAVP